MTKRIAQAFIALIVFGVLSVSALAQSPSTQESVAEAARKAREQKKSPAKPGKVITNDELSAVAASGKQPSVVGQGETKGAAETGQGEAKGASTGEQGAGEKKPSESDESRWRKQFAGLYHKLHQAQAELDVLQREWGKLQSQYYSDPQKALQQQNNRSDVNDHQQKIDAKKKEIDQLQQNIASLQDELRRSGGDGSWGREQ